MHLKHLIVVALAALLGACGSCGSNEEAVALARGLSQERLAQLFLDVQALRPNAGQVDIYIDTRSDSPIAFKDLQPQSIISDGYRARVHLSGCGDDKVYLMIRGIDGAGRKEITLLPGETKDPVLLWQFK